MWQWVWGGTGGVDPVLNGDKVTPALGDGGRGTTGGVEFQDGNGILRDQRLDLSRPGLDTNIT